MTRDKLGRELRDLRVSITDRCNLRCNFCMPDGEDYQFFRRDEILRFEEIRDFVKAIIPLGVKKVRLTGGEPLIRKDVEKLIAMLSDLPLEDLSLTTNGLKLKEKARALKASGLKRVTVSLPSLRDHTLSKLVGREVKVSKILEGIQEALHVGLSPVKVNVCIIKGVNHEEIVDMVGFFKDVGVTVRFIEFMDVGNLNEWSMDRVFSVKEMRDVISQHYDLEPVERSYRGEVAQRYRHKDSHVEVGFVSSVTQPFCGDCNRLRLTADGRLLTCLFAQEGHDIKGLLRANADEETVRRFVCSLWAEREDNYSEKRLELINRGIIPKKIEMFKIGG
ncbi:MAG: GTP 3',8-cyclase MoaA [Aquificaceae bacterium]|nr:GTP 3',8-cyclase MoaA [Aquificaceae bacterium]